MPWMLLWQQPAVLWGLEVQSALIAATLCLTAGALTDPELTKGFGNVLPLLLPPPLLL